MGQRHRTTGLFAIVASVAATLWVGAPAASAASATQVSAGEYHTCALTTRGGVKCWGDNGEGELGDGTTKYRGSPVDVIGLGSGVKAISAGGNFTCALTIGGGVKCWGRNVYGQLGDGTGHARRSPVDVIGLGSGVEAISTGEEHTCALTTAGGVKCWGDNGEGQLGDGTTTLRRKPVEVIGLGSGVKAIAAGGAHTCALTTGGGVKCWGHNRGEVGDGTRTNRTSPVDVKHLGSGVKAITAAGIHTCALTTVGGVKCWGKNRLGQLGDGTGIQRLTPVDVKHLGSGVKAITGGGAHSCALTVGGGVKCWGFNGNGELGDGTTKKRFKPVDVYGLGSGGQAISAGSGHNCVVTTGGGVKCWGDNYWLQLGDGTRKERHTPVDVIGFRGHASDPAAIPGSQVWVKRFQSPDADYATGVEASPDGSEVFVTGIINGTTLYSDSVVIAYDASTGSKLWMKRHNGGPATSHDGANDLGVSPDGSTVFVTGASYGPSGYEYATVAYDATTGSRLWSKRYRGPGNREATAGALGVSPDGSRVFVTGGLFRSSSKGDYATVAYDASTGSQLWVKRYTGKGNSAQGAHVLGVGPDGSTVFVTGMSGKPKGDSDYATVAYDAADGSQLWVKRYAGPGTSEDTPNALGVSPNGAELFVTGSSERSSKKSRSSYTTVAYQASNGSQLWVKRYDGPANDDIAQNLGVSPDGSTVFVTGSSGASESRISFATIAYGASSGATRWVKRYNGPGHSNDTAVALGVSPDGSQVFVGGTTWGSRHAITTVAYHASTGSRLWTKAYHGPGGSDDARALEVSPDGSKVFVTGSSLSRRTDFDLATIAYSIA